jgi:Flp pilus assembly protein TadG
MNLRDEDGAVTLWMLVLSVILLSLGGLSVDLWQVLADRRDLASMADAAAYAAAGRVDESHYRATGEVALHVEAATAAAAAILAARDGTGADLIDADVVIAPDAATVTLVARTDTVLLRLLDPSLQSLDLTVTSRAAPRVVP